MKRYILVQHFERSGQMVEKSDGDWVRYEDLIDDKGIIVLGVPIGHLHRLISEVNEYTGKRVEEWFKHADERIVSAATAFVEYVPGMRWKKTEKVGEITPRMGYQMVSLIPEAERIEEIRRTYQHEQRVRVDLLKTGESLWNSSVQSPVPRTTHEIVARLVDWHIGDDFGLFLIRRKKMEQ